MTDRKEPLDIEKAEYRRMIAAKLDEAMERPARALAAADRKLRSLDKALAADGGPAAKLNKTAWAAPSAGREIARFGAALRQEVRGVLPAAGYRLPAAPLRPAAPRRPLGVRHDDPLLVLGALLGLFMSGDQYIGCLVYAAPRLRSKYPQQAYEVSKKNLTQEHEEVLQIGYGVPIRPRVVQRRQQRQAEKRNRFQVVPMLLAEHEGILT